MIKKTSMPNGEELRVLDALVVHGSMENAARALGVSYCSVDYRVDRLRVKSQRRTLHQVIAWAYENGWLPLQSESPGRLSEELERAA